MSTAVVPTRRSRRTLSPPMEPRHSDATASASLTKLLRRGQTVVARRDDEPYVETRPRVSRTGIVERSMAAAVIAAARQRARKPRARDESLRPPHHTVSGFCNPWESAVRDSVRLRPQGSRTFFHKVAKDRRPPDEQLASILLLADRPRWAEAADALQRDKYALVSFWLGHCTFLFQANGITVLSDPVWSQRLGPLGPRRLVPPSCEVADLPSIDVVLISSANYDHFDKTTVAALKSKVDTWLVPLGLKPLLVAAGVADAAVVQLDWWQEHRVGNVLFACTPSQHCSVRDDALWSSWAISAEHHRWFYCGATGYRAVMRDLDDSESFEHRAKFGAVPCPAFKEIGRRYGPFDTAFLPIGGFKPRPAMSSVQGDAIDMLFVHKDLRSKRSVVHRWGTFACNDEGMLDAVRTLELGILNSPIPEHEVSYVRHGRLHVT